MSEALTLSLGVRSAPRSAPTRRACEAASRFGLLLDGPDATADTDAPRRVARALLSATPGARVTLIEGPSGAGKTTLLRALHDELEQLGATIINPDRLRLRHTPIVNLIPGDVDDALRLLASCGLGEARLLIRRPDELSDGQRRRARLAVALARARRRSATLLTDDFASGLDRDAARSLASTIARAARRCDRPLIIATTRDDLAPLMAPDVHARIDLQHRVTITTRRPDAPAPDPHDEFIIEAGHIADYDTLAPAHYRAARPARPVRTDVVRETHRGDIAGVLVIAMPTLNAAWRTLVWPGRYDAPDRRLATRRLNEEVRRIARVVIDERFRGRGLATRLVRHYLDAPLTPRTETVAGMGRWSRFFERAGMTALPLAPNPASARLLDALDHAGIEPWRLATPEAALHRATRNAGDAFVDRELRAWARGGRATRGLASAPIADLFRAACRSIGATPIAYVQTAPGWSSTTP